MAPYVRGRPVEVQKTLRSVPGVFAMPLAYFDEASTVNA
jgi:hypothetical protein